MHKDLDLHKYLDRISQIIHLLPVAIFDCVIKKVIFFVFWILWYFLKLSMNIMESLFASLASLIRNHFFCSLIVMQWGIHFFLNSSTPECSTKVKYKIDHNSETKNHTKKTHKIRFRTWRIVRDDKKNNFSRVHRDNLKLTISRKLKMGKLNINSFLNIAQQFGQKNGNGSFWGCEGGL